MVSQLTVLKVRWGNWDAAYILRSQRFSWDAHIEIGYLNTLFTIKTYTKLKRLDLKSII